MRLRRLLELAVVLMALGIAAGFIHARFEDIQRESRRVQVRMAAESLRTNGALLQLQCPDLADTPCLRRALSRLQRARVIKGSVPEAAALPPTLEGAEARLWALALASGLEGHQVPGSRWSLRFQAPDTLHVGMTGVIDCRFLLRIHLKSGLVSVEDQLLAC